MFVALLTFGMVSSAAAQELNASYQSSTDDWDGTTTETDSSLEGDNTQDSGDNLEEDTTSVDARVTSKVAIEVTPEDLNYPYVDIGEQETVSNESFESLTVLNTGSEPIDKVWVNTSTPSDDPFGDTNGASEFDAGNFFQVNITGSTNSKYDTATTLTDAYHYINRKEYNFQDSDETPSFLVAPNGTEEVTIGGAGGGSGTSPSELEKGALRLGGEEYYYVLLEDSGCGGTGEAELRVGDTPFTANQEGTLDFTDDGPDGQDRDYTVYDLTNTDASYGIVDNSGNGVTLGDREYDVLTACADSGFQDDKEHLLRTKYNVNPGPVSDLESGNGDVASFIFDGGPDVGEGELIYPSEFITMDAAVEVPRGVTQGQLGSGTFRVFVTSDVSET